MYHKCILSPKHTRSSKEMKLVLLLKKMKENKEIDQMTSYEIITFSFASDIYPHIFCLENNKMVDNTKINKH